MTENTGSTTPETFQEVFLDALVRVAMEPVRDEYGNVVPSRLDTVFSNWWANNRTTIVDAVLERLDTQELAEKVAAKVAEVVTAKPWNWQATGTKKALDDLVRAKVAERLAAQVVLPEATGASDA